MPPPPQIPLAAIRQPAFLYGPDGRVAAANDRAEALAGRPLAGRSPADVIAIFAARRPDGTPLVPAELPVSRALAGEEVIDIPLVITGSDGRTVHVLATVSPLRDGDAITGAFSVWQDVTEGRRTEMELVSIARFPAENPNPIMRLDNGRTIIYANVAARTMLGGTFTGLDTDATDDIARIAMTAHVSGIMHEMEYSKGDETYLLSFIPLADRHSMNIYGETITKRKRVEELLRRRVEELETMMETVPVAIWVAQDPECREITGNRMANEFNEAREGENVSAGPPPGEPVPPRRFFAGGRELAAEELPMQFGAAQGVEVRNAELEVLLPSGRRIVMLGSASPLREASGTMRGCMGAFLDITERKQREEHVRRHEAALEGITRILTGALTCETEEELGVVCLEVAETITESRFGFIGQLNEAGLQDIAITDPGWDACAIIDATGHSRPPGNFALHGIYGRVLRDGRSLFTNDPFNHPDSIGTPPGHPPLTAVLGVPLVRAGRTIGIIALANREGGYSVGEQQLLEALVPVIVEAFARKRAEQGQKQFAEQLRTSNEELQRFAYVASHDLQEPLRSIVSFSQLLDRRYSGRLDEDADEYIRFIVEGGVRMQALILDLLQVSRVETCATPPVPTDANDPAGDALRSLEPSIREAGATVTVDPVPVVMVDPAQLEQVFVNLVGNAIKYRHPDRPIEVRVSAERRGAMVEFSVADNGIGIEAEYFGRIFEMFRRLHTNDKYSGTGIGLAVVKKIIERHGGRVRVESMPGEGSTFFFTLPAA